MATGEYNAEQLLDYDHVDLTRRRCGRAMLERDEFNFNVNVQFGEAPVSEVRATLARLMREHQNLVGAAAGA